MSDEVPLVEKIKQWTERVGYALELRVARQFLQMPECTRVRPSCPYWDRQGDRWREADVAALFAAPSYPSVRLQVVAECKSGSTHPWVIFTDVSSGTEPELMFDQALKVASGDARDMRQVWDQGKGTAALPTSTAGYSIVEARVDHKKPAPEAKDPDKDDNTAQVPYRAVRQAVTAATHLSAQAPAAPQGAWVQFTLPVVVTAARLFECSLDERAEISVVETSYSTLQVQSKSSRALPRIVHVMTESYVPTFRGDLSRSLNAMALGAPGRLNRL